MAQIVKKADLDKRLDTLGKLARFDVTGVPLLFASGRRSLRFHFIYPAVGEKGGCVNLFKVLQSNLCEHNCFYCVNRKARNCPRVEFTPEELSQLFLHYWKKGWVRGLFLSSAIHPSPDQAQEKMLRTILLLRRRYGYCGYIHCKILPGTDEAFIEKIGPLADRLSINLEAPTQKYLSRLSPDKQLQPQLLEQLKKIAIYHSIHPLRAGVTTQLVVGASGESDREILSLSQDLYRTYGLSRVYYSGFIPVRDTPLEQLPPCLPLRELRLYQADFLLRRYGFHTEELFFEEEKNLPLDKDPKLAWALNHPDRFPVELNTASFEELIRVPGIGRISAKRIIETRRVTRFKDLDQLRRVGAVTGRAQGFITLSGKFYPPKRSQSEKISKQLFLWEEI
ncbi:MAG: putative DNA modification/repair radical SAM protein [Candidatus Latescibacterota bacterium]|nr:MAG: putative DNA modification/repair radical SAM protein [Candidatus Latescibacterota bacterium]RKY71942.1 MAG: putative DNA modification/repair radical SAM protein [Candidatus Latescibacterota bacterium]HDN67698.1 putative DNA modification/repair radical SAM protein [Bacillota bacterium]